MAIIKHDAHRIRSQYFWGSLLSMLLDVVLGEAVRDSVVGGGSVRDSG